MNRPPRRLFPAIDMARRREGSSRTLHLGSAGRIFARRNRSIWGFGLVAVALVAASGPMTARAPLALVNMTPSEPLGLYLRTRQAVAQNRLVAFAPPPAAGSVGDGHLARFHSFLKRIAAVGGDRICSDGWTTRINGAFAARVAQRDGRGQVLPRWIGCRQLAADELFVLSTRVPNSFDSRYFGPVSRRSVIGVYRPAWTLP